MKCHLCEAAATRKHIVIGRGKIPAKLLFIGEAPGRTEDLFGEPFVGRSGRLLDEMLLEAEIYDDYYITNAVLCRPTTADDQNREPTEQEVLNCMQHVCRLSDMVHPALVVFIGKVAERYYKKVFTGFNTTILHPSFVLRKGGKASPWFMHNVTILRKAKDEILS